MRCSEKKKSTQRLFQLIRIMRASLEDAAAIETSNYMESDQSVSAPESMYPNQLGVRVAVITGNILNLITQTTTMMRKV